MRFLSNFYVTDTFLLQNLWRSKSLFFSIFTEVWLTNKHCIYLGCTMWFFFRFTILWFDKRIYSEVITTIRKITYYSVLKPECWRNATKLPNRRFWIVSYVVLWSSYIMLHMYLSILWLYICQCLSNSNEQYMNYLEIDHRFLPISSEIMYPFFRKR